MLSVKPEVVSTLVDCFEHFSRELEEGQARALRARARDMPAELVSKGFSYVMVLTATRGDLDVVRLGLTSTSCRDLVELVKKKGLRGDDAGYALYGALLLLSLGKSGVISGGSFADIVKSSLNDPTLNQVAYAIMDWVKRLAEAYLERE
jgi:hypothetical protein